MAQLLVEAVVWIFVELIFYIVFYGIGWVVIRIVTFGKHPGPWRGLPKQEVADVELVALVGLLATVAVAAVYYFNFVH